MKKILILLIFNSIYTIANEQTVENNCTDCKAIFFHKKIEKTNSELIICKDDQTEIISPSISSTWIEIVVEDGVDIFQLALKYYGDRDKYEQIYITNRDTIGDDLQIRDGMSLKIPIIEQFEEQPMFVNMD